MIDNGFTDTSSKKDFFVKVINKLGDDIFPFIDALRVMPQERMVDESAGDYLIRRKAKWVMEKALIDSQKVQMNQK